MRLLIDLTGKSFGSWTVIQRAKNRNNSPSSYWLCRCECGVESVRQGGSLKSGDSTGCRKCSALRFADDQSVWGRGLPYRWLYDLLLRSAEERHLTCVMTFNEFVEFTATNSCHYCGDSIVWSKWNHHNSGKYNIDRKDNTLGYSKDNCVVCCTTCNRAKGARYDHETWFAMTQVLRDRRTTCTRNF